MPATKTKPTTLLLGDGPGTKPFEVDLDLLLRSRLLIQANSGGGKSWLLRRLAEQAVGKVPTVLLDPEGEFATLRERFPFVLVGKGGETPADVRTAPIVAKRLLELGASAVIDLYEMSIDARHAWVAAFLAALIDAPKALWRQMLLLVDEAHTFCPERGAGESPATEGMLALSTRGRKRGYGAVWATQRLGKLRKDGAAEMQNLLVGQTFIDLDRERAADALGISRAGRAAFNEQVKTMAPGTFYALGRAFGRVDPMRIKVGDVVTTHPEPGGRAPAAPPAPEKVRALMAKLADLPKEAADEADRFAALEGEVRDLRRQLAEAKRSAPALAPAKVRVDRVPFVPPAVEKSAQAVFAAIQAVGRAVAALGTRDDELNAAITEAKGATLATAVKATAQNSHPPAAPAPRSDPRPAGGDDLGGRSGEIRILRALAAVHPKPLTVAQIGRLAVMKTSGGSFSTYMSRLRVRGLIEKDGQGTVTLTAEGLAQAGPVQPREGARSLVDMWGPKLGGSARAMLELFATEHGPFSKEDVAARLGLEASGGSFSTYLSRLRSAGLITKTAEGFVASEEIRL